MMKDAISPFKDCEAFKNAFLVLGKNPVLGILIGAAVTAIIQSSSASVSILQTLAALALVPWNAAVYIILGQNIGTCITAMLSSIGANKTAKRAAYIHLLFNVIGSVLFAIITIIYLNIINVSLGNRNITSTEISIFHTIFNITVTLVLFPFANRLVNLSKRIVKGSDIVTVGEPQMALKHMDERILETPSFAVENAIKEVVNMGQLSLKNTKLATEALLEKDKNKIECVIKSEKDINALEKLITEYLVKISNTSLSEHQNIIVTNLFHTINDIERVGDHAENIAELAQYYLDNDCTFSETALVEFRNISRIAIETLEYAIKARETENTEYIRKVEQNEELVDTLEEELREKHINRLSNNICDSSTGVVFLDSINNYERISDHALNIAYYIKDEII